ncbi:MAG: hypothetical protein ACI9RV_002514 [Glaciecola sp.]|jgi:hypothetical protein
MSLVLLTFGNINIEDSQHGLGPPELAIPCCVFDMAFLIHRATLCLYQVTNLSLIKALLAAFRKSGKADLEK